MFFGDPFTKLQQICFTCMVVNDQNEILDCIFQSFSHIWTATAVKLDLHILLKTHFIWFIRICLSFTKSCTFDQRKVCSFCLLWSLKMEFYFITQKCKKTKSMKVKNEISLICLMLRWFLFKFTLFYDITYFPIILPKKLL